MVPKRLVQAEAARWAIIGRPAIIAVAALPSLYRGRYGHEGLIARSTPMEDSGPRMKLSLPKIATAALLLTSVGVSLPAPAQPPRPTGQVVVREQMVVRMRGRATTPAIQWTEKKGPKCLPARTIAGAAMIGRHSVDLVLRDRRRIRAKLENSCPALDYYYGFYITPNKDGMICADRDIIRSRMGGQCEIDGFRTLEAKAAQ